MFWINIKDIFLSYCKYQEIEKAKGINRNFVDNIRDKKYSDVLFNKNLIRHKMKRIQSKLYRIRTYDVWETSLSCWYNKRYILDDGINSLAYFHKDVRSLQNQQNQVKTIKLIKSSKVNKINRTFMLMKKFFGLHSLYSVVYILREQ